MPRTLTRDDLMDMLHGAAILGTGGGGEIAEGVGLIDDALARGKAFRLATLDEAPDAALLCTPYMLGAIADLPTDDEALFDGVHPILLAYDAFERQLGQQFWGTVPCELGGSNTAIAFYAAAMRGAVMCDADPAGRAVPEITHSTYFLSGLPAAPIVMANAFGETFTAHGVADDQRAEEIVRALSMASRNDIAAIDHALPAGMLAPALLHGTVSAAIELGAVWRAGVSEPETLPDKIAAAAGGFVAFRGCVTESVARNEGGFTVGQYSLRGTGAYEGHHYKISVKNENMATWFEGAVHATVPDLICALDTDSGAPVTNPHSFEGQNIAVLILPAHPAFQTPRALRVFGPDYAGVAGSYVPARPVLPPGA